MSVRLIYAIIAAFIVTGCASPLEKTILHPLKAKEIDRVVRKDKSFLTTYSIVEEKWNYISTPQDSARWRDITYGRLHTFLQTINSPELNSPLFTKLREKWEELNIRNNEQADAIVAGWRDYLTLNSPDSLLSISFSGIEIEKVRNIRKQIDTLLRARIQLKALKGKIDSLSFLYSFAIDSLLVPNPDSITVADTVAVADTSAAMPVINSVNYRRAVKDSVIIKVFPELQQNLRAGLIANDSSIIFNYKLKSVYSGGKCYNTDSLKADVPYPVLALIEAEMGAGSPDFDANYYREQIIRGEIDQGFISQGAYIKINAEQYYRQLDSLVFSYINYSGAL